MGAWANTAFGNDSATDWLDMLRERDWNDWGDAIADVLRRFDAFEASRASGTNKRIHTAEYAEMMINAFDPPLVGDMAELARKGIGQEFEYPGDDETYELVAAAALILAIREGSVSALPPEAQQLPVSRLAVSEATRLAFVKALGQVPNNKRLCRDCGPGRKRKVAALAKALEGAA